MFSLCVSIYVSGNKMGVDPAFSQYQFVEAVAGAGKTTMLVNRFCSVVGQGTVVAITYTNKAAYEMKRRIQAQLGRPTPVLVMTVHQFCGMILRLFPFDSQWPIAFSVLDGGAADMMRRQAVARVMHERCRRADADWLAMVAWVSDYQLERIVLKLLAYPGLIAGLSQSVPALYRLTRESLAVYGQLKSSQGALDFDDLMSHARSVLKQVGSGPVQHLLLDEAQDTNADQWALVQLCGVLGTDVSRETSVFIVGDAAQSIYSFQGAEPDIFYTMATAVRGMPGGSVAKSVQNYRCSESVIGFVNGVFSGWMPEFQPLVPTTGEQGSVRCWFGAMSFDARMDAIAQYCHAYINKHPERTWSDIAILCRKKKSFSRYRAALVARGVPCSVQDRWGFYRQPEVRFLIQAIHAFSDPYANEAWVAVLTALGVAPGTLAVLAVERGRAWPDRLVQIQGADASGWQDLCLTAHSVSVQAWLYGLLTGLGVWRLFPLPQACANMRQLIQLAVAALARPGMALPQLIEAWYDAMRHDTSVEQALVESVAGVRVMTIHSAKGLEFDCVIAPELDSLFNKSKDPVLVDSGELSVNVPPFEASHDAVYQRLRESALDEERRLFYVACTRAKRDLYLLGVPSAVPKVKHMLDVLRSEFVIDDAWVTLQSTGARYANGPVDGAVASGLPVPDSASSVLVYHSPPPSRQYVSVSALGDYLVSPDSFAMRDAARAQKMALADGVLAAQFGEAVHAVFAHQLRYPDVSGVQAISDAVVDRAWMAVAQKHRARLQALADRFQLSDCYAWLLSGLVHVEWPFSVWIEDVCVSGRLDALAYCDGVWWVVDFKTDRVPVDPLPIAYQRQLAIYVLVLGVLYPNQPCQAGVYWCETGQFVPHDVSRETQALRDHIVGFPAWMQTGNAR